MDSQHLQRWLYGWHEPRALRLQGALTGATLLLMTLPWAPYLRDFFSTEGYVSTAFVSSTTPYSTWSFLLAYDAPWFIRLVYTCFLFAAAALIFGRFRKIARTALYVIFLAFTARFPLVQYGGTDAMLALLFFGCFFHYARPLTSWAVRMGQFTVAGIYLFSALAKIMSPTWMNGTELAVVLGSRFTIIDFTALSLPASAYALMAYGVITVELSLPFLIFQEGARRFALCAGIAMHIGILITMNVSAFNEVMFCGLALFVTDRDLKYLQNLCMRGLHRAVPALSKVGLS